MTVGYRIHPVALVLTVLLLGGAPGEQLLHVTLKAGEQARRVERKVVKVSGEGVVEVTFEIPAAVRGDTVSDRPKIS